MKLLAAHKISGEILDIIHDAKQHLVIVSPYVDIIKWARLAEALTLAKDRGVNIDFFVRGDADNVSSWEQVANLGIRPRLVNNLHAKLYFNEVSGIISSMNLLSSSNNNSIEIGCKVDGPEDLASLRKFVEDYIVPHESAEPPSAGDIYLKKERFTNALRNHISGLLQENCDVTLRNGEYSIRVGSETFPLLIDQVNNRIGMYSFITRHQETLYSALASKFLTSPFFKYELFPGRDREYSQIGAFSEHPLTSSTLDHLRVQEKKIVISEVGLFVQSIGLFKRACYEAERR